MFRIIVHLIIWFWDSTADIKNIQLGFFVISPTMNDMYDIFVRMINILYEW